MHPRSLLERRHRQGCPLGDICRGSTVALGGPATTGVGVPKAKQIAAVLLLAMHDSVVKVRTQAIWSLARIGPLARIDPVSVKFAVENDPVMRSKLLLPRRKSCRRRHGPNEP